LYGALPRPYPYPYPYPPSLQAAQDTEGDPEFPETLNPTSVSILVEGFGQEVYYVYYELDTFFDVCAFSTTTTIEFEIEDCAFISFFLSVHLFLTTDTSTLISSITCEQFSETCIVALIHSFQPLPRRSS
jgi:hypothetical protein